MRRHRSASCARPRGGRERTEMPIEKGRALIVRPLRKVKAPCPARGPAHRRPVPAAIEAVKMDGPPRPAFAGRTGPRFAEPVIAAGNGGSAQLDRAPFVLAGPQFRAAMRSGNHVTSSGTAETKIVNSAMITKKGKVARAIR